MRADQALPGDLVIRARQDRSGPLPITVWVVTRWPDTDHEVAGPYQSARIRAATGIRGSPVTTPDVSGGTTHAPADQKHSRT